MKAKEKLKEDLLYCEKRGFITIHELKNTLDCLTTQKAELLGLNECCRKNVERARKIERKLIASDIKELIKKEKKCLKRDKYQEQFIEHYNQIEMANKILKSLE